MEAQQHQSGPPESPQLMSAAERRKLQEALTLALSRAEGYLKALTTALRKICVATGWDYAESWIPSRDGTILKPGPVWPRVKPAFKEFKDRSRRLGFLRGNDLPGRVLQTRRPEWIEDVSSGPKQLFGRCVLAEEAGLRAALAVPVLAGDDVMAVLVFYSERPASDDRARMELVASVLAPLGPFLERKKIEEELTVRARQQEAVARLGLEALEESDIDNVVRHAVELSTEIIEAEYGEMLESDPESGALFHRAGGHEHEWVAPDGSPEEAGSHATYTRAANEPIAVEDFEKEERCRLPARLDERSLASGLCVVIPGHHRPVGVLGAYSTRRRRFTPNDINFLQGVANVLGTAIERARAERELEGHRRHLEQLVEERTKKLASSHEQLRQAERLASIGTLAAGLGHDMKNVLLPVLCRLDALEEEAPSEEARDKVRAVRKSLDFLRQLSHGLRLFALDPEDPEASGDGITRLDAWWGEVGPLLEKSLPKEVTFSRDIPSSLPPVRVAGHRLTQAVLNLLVNAGEATGGKGRVRVWAERAANGAAVRLGVTDNGRGMSHEIQRHALDPFFTTRKRELSTGLGLSLVHGVATAVGGAVSIDSEEGRGTTVEMTLPTVESARGAPVSALAEGDRVAAVSLQDGRIAAFVSTLLRSAGFEVKPVPATDPVESILWITASRAGFKTGVLRYLEQGPDRRVIVLGRPAGAKDRPRLTYVDRPDNLEGLRQSLRAAVHELLETTDVF